jgi:hypothetical protein
MVTVTGPDSGSLGVLKVYVRLLSPSLATKFSLPTSGVGV